MIGWLHEKLFKWNAACTQDERFSFAKSFCKFFQTRKRAFCHTAFDFDRSHSRTLGENEVNLMISLSPILNLRAGRSAVMQMRSDS